MITSNKPKADDRLLTDPPMAATRNFVGRTTELQKITESIQRNQKLVLVNGIGGIGKSEIAKKLFHRWYDEGIAGYEEIAYFGWIPYTGDIKGALAESLHRTRKIENKEDAYREAVRYINALGKKLVLFIDNVNTPPKEDIAIITSLTCNVILTSRTTEIAQCEPIEIGRLDEKECFEIYTRHCPQEQTHEETIRKIIRKADCHTLAVELLAKTQKASRDITPEALLEMIEGVGFNLRGIDETVERDGNDAVFIEHMAKLFSLAHISEAQKHILQLFAVLPYLPLQGERLKKWFAEKNYNNVNALVKSGWLTENEGNTFQMHPVIAGTVLYSAKPVYTDIEQMIDTIAEDLKVGEIEVFTEKLPFVPFAESAAKYCIEELQEESSDTALLEHNIGSILSDQGEYEKALEWYEKARMIREKVLGNEHPHTAITYNNIATVYSRMGEYSTALEWYKKACMIVEKVFGITHPHIIPFYNNIANGYHDQGEYSVALEWYEKAHVIQEQVLGNEHPHTATTYNNIAAVYSDMGKYDVALEWYGKACAIREKTLGNDHPSTATTYNNIAAVYSDMGKSGVALEWYEKARMIDEQILGNDHPHTATTYHNIAAVYSRMREYGVALEWYEKAHVIREKRLGKEHPDTASTYHNIAEIYCAMGDHNTALEWFEKARVIVEKVLGNDHPHTATTYHNIALVYSRMGEYSVALEWYGKARSIYEKMLGEKHPDTVSTYNNIANVYSAMGEYERALILYRKAYKVILYHLGQNHPNTQICYDNMSEAYIKTGRDRAKFEAWLSASDDPN